MTTRASRNPANDTQEFASIEFNGVTLQLRTKFKIFKFMRMIDTNPIGALTLALSDESAEAIEDIEMDFKDFETLVNKITDALSGTDLKN